MLSFFHILLSFLFPKEGFMVLTDSQQKAFDLALAGTDLFVAGKVGTGKSSLAKYIYGKLKEAGKNVVLASTTARGAFELGGVSVHELLNLKNNGINFATQKMIIHKTPVLLIADVIIVDDISDANIALMDTLLCTIAKTEEISTKKQLIIFGDFYLPAPELPIDEIESYKEYYPKINIDVAYAFKAPSWFKRNFRNITLDYPSSVSKGKADIINSIINNGGEKLIDYSLNHLAPRYKSVYSANICVSQKEADELNQKGFNEIDDNSFILRAKVKSENKEPVNTELFGIPKKLDLKVGQKVVLLEDRRSYGSELYNYHKGSFAIIKKIVPHQYITVELSNRVQVNIEAVTTVKKRCEVENGKIKEIDSIQIRQFPLKPAYAISVDDCRGLFFDNAIILNNPESEKNGSFFYSALSHCNNLDAVYFSNPVEPPSISQDVLEFYSDPSKKKYSWNSEKKYIKKVSSFYEDMIPGYRAIDEAIHDMKFSHEKRAKILNMILDMANKLKEDALMDKED